MNNNDGKIAKLKLPLSQRADDASDDFARPMEILVAEDNNTNQRVITLILNQLGHNVTITKNGQECLERLNQQYFDAILMDLHMPIMDGWTATKEIRKTNTIIPIIALTADTRPEARDMTYDVGMDGYLTKPLLVERLYEVLQSINEKRHNLDECDVKNIGNSAIFN